jgi:diguanylate cyclase (GGDEF)-like protein
MKQRVLLIDDSEEIHVQVRLMLDDETVEVSTASCGPEGIAAAKKQPPDLILLDVDMPAPNGFDVCNSLKSDPMTLTIPIIFLTGMSSTKEKIRGLNLGAIDYVTKPFEPAELRARVQSALRTKYLIDLLAQRAMVDGLTGLWNRTYFEKRLSAELASSARTQRVAGVIAADVDHFKKVNDTYGHPAGDKILRGVAQTMLAAIRQEDVLCRLGGEEFALITGDAADGGAAALAERLRKAIAQARFVHQGAQISVTCSFGVAQSGGDHGVNPNIAEQADAALYMAKRMGRNQVKVAGDATSDKCDHPQPAADHNVVAVPRPISAIH